MTLYFFTGFDPNGWTPFRCRADYANSPTIMQASVADGRYHSDGYSRQDEALHLFNSAASIQMIEWDVGAQTDIVIGADMRPAPAPSAVDTTADLLQLSHGSGYTPATLSRKLLITWNEVSKEFRFYQNRSGTGSFGGDAVSWPGTSVVLLGSTGSLGDLFGTDALNPLWRHLTFVLRSGGTSELWSEGVQIWSGALGSFGPFHRAGLSWNRYGFYGWQFDNFYLGSENLGMVRVSGDVPRVDYSLSGIVPSLLAYDTVNDFYPLTAPDTSTYLEGSAYGAKALFYMTRMYPFQEIFGVQLTAWAQTTSPSVTFRIVARAPEGVEYYSGEFTIYTGYSQFSTTYQPLRILWSTDPHTGLTWDEDRLLSYAFGVETRSDGNLRISQLMIERLSAVGVAAFSIYRAR